MTLSEYFDTMISDPALGVETNNSDLMETIAAAAKPYFERGLSAVQEQRTIRTFDEAADIIKANFIKNGIPPQLVNVIKLRKAGSHRDVGSSFFVTISE